MPERNYLTPPTSRLQRLPPWFKIKRSTGENYLALRQIVKRQGLHTVCEEAQCPNIWECWNAKTATFMILGDICTRSCGFCAVSFGRPTELDRAEPARLAEAVCALGLRHAVITSVNRDELENGGAEIFSESVHAIRARAPDCTIELLTPDFQGSAAALSIVLMSQPDILAHNLETVPRCYPSVRPQAKYERSLAVLERAREAGCTTKTGLMLGLGETPEEVRGVMRDLARIRCNILTLGQYLQPTAKHLPVSRFVHPDAFAALKQEGEAMGIPHVEAGPLVRSSYHAANQYDATQSSTRRSHFR
jgi:lipoic acid synthetase